MSDLEAFRATLDGAIDDALQQGINAELLELELQKRAQDLREFERGADA